MSKKNYKISLSTVVELDEEALEFYKENPDATVESLVNAEIDPKIEETTEEAVSDWNMENQNPDSETPETKEDATGN